MTKDSAPCSLAPRMDYPRIMDWDSAYSNRGAVPSVDDWLANSTRKSKSFISNFSGAKYLGVKYRDCDRQTFDIIEPSGPILGTAIFVHGGYWRSTSTSDHFHFAQGAILRQWRVVMIEYPLCPTVRISQIAEAVVSAIETVLEVFPEGLVTLTGHSAGGHLATYATSKLSSLRAAARGRIRRVVSLSGLHDLRPLLRASELNRDLNLAEDEATLLSPALSEPGHRFDLFCICGGGELAEFQRQTLLLGTAWGGISQSTRMMAIGELDHFRILDELTRSDSDLTKVITINS
ncbi:alpha/beta hydrolase [Ensifer sp. ENS05]|uniref:alpha/beta hydrolase n=1 Tax=Ensifer sp. ENS05 TaxID=2769277 RepID=UPI0017810639|nr:alpha/beta hydrolase [Ensifer sp. ENS05]MBD9596888.1 alpha/beta hydrolase [Ensifer sp. ENS05]